MKEFLIFVQKEWFHIFRDRWTVIILLVMPVLMVILFGHGINTEVKDIKFKVYMPSRDIIAQEIVEKLDASEYFNFTGYLQSPEVIEKEFHTNGTGLVVVFSDNFSQNIYHTGEAQIQLITDGSNPNTASTITTYTSGTIQMYQQKLMQSTHIPFQITPEIKLLYNPTMKSTYNIVPGVIGMIIMLICAMMTSVSIAREKEFGTIEVLLVSPMKPVFIILSKIVPYFVISIVNLITVLLISYFALGVPINGSLMLLFSFSLLFILVSLSLGLVISTIANSQIVALLASAMGLMMPAIMLSGMMFPIENIPVILQYVSHMVPAKWYITGLRDIMIKGLGFSYILKETLILLGMGTVLITVALRNFKIRLE